MIRKINKYINEHELVFYKCFTLILLAMLCFVACYDCYMLTIYSGKPQIALHKDILWKNDTTQTIGLYHPQNTIDVSIKAGNIGQTLVHEYGHYLYYKILSKEDRDYFDNDLCVNYFSGYRCEEQFAELFARNIIYNLDGDDEINIYFNNIREQYLE